MQSVWRPHRAAQWQSALFLDEEEASADQIFAEALEQEALGGLDQVMRLYSLAEKLEKLDPA